MIKRIEFTAINGRPISFLIKEIAVILARNGGRQTEIFVTGNDDGFFVNESYAEVMKKIEEAENAGV